MSHTRLQKILNVENGNQFILSNTSLCLKLQSSTSRPGNKCPLSLIIFVANPHDASHLADVSNLQEIEGLER